MAQSRNKIIELLAGREYEILMGMASGNKGVLRQLISLTYDKSGILCWRAIEASGLIVARMTPQEARDSADRVFWMMRDESGGNAWSAPEILGEMIRNRPEKLGHLVPMLVSFREEEIFCAGILYALSRIASADEKLAMPYRELAFLYLKHPSPPCRGNALLLLRGLKADTYASSIKELSGDRNSFTYYNGGELAETTLGELALEILDAIKA